MANISEETKWRIWESCTTVEGYNADKYRKDACGAWIAWSDYGQESNFGWEIDHILPKAKGGTNHADNLRALHWENNRSKGDDFPSYSRKVIAHGQDNIADQTMVTVHKNLITRLKKTYPANPVLLSI